MVSITNITLRRLVIGPRSWILLLVALLAGCGRDTADAGVCADDGQCAAGELCNREVGRCMPLSAATLPLGIQPPTDNKMGWVPQEFAQPTLGPDGRLTLTLEPGISLQGSVYASDSASRGVPARVLAWRDSLISGRQRVQTETTVSINRDDGSPASYVLWLNSGLSYTFYVSPLPPYDAEYPPLVLPGVKVQSHTRRDLVLEGKDRTVLVRGKVLNTNALPLPAQVLLEQGGQSLETKVRVAAYEENGLYRSTVATADGSSGAFTFRVPASSKAPATGRTYTIRADAQPGSAPVPTVVCSGIVLGIYSGSGGAQYVGDLHLPAFRMAKNFSVKVRGEDGSPVAGAAVKFHLDFQSVPQNEAFNRCTATYERSATTDAAGKVVLPLFPSPDKKNLSYRVTVISPSTSPHASRVISAFEVGPSDGGVLADIVLQRRYRYSGRVVTAEGQPVPGATIEARGVDDGTVSKSDGLQPATTSAISGSEGQFSLYVEQGIYDFSVRPPRGAGLPGICVTAKRIDGDLHNLTFRISQPSVLAGTVVDERGNPVDGVRVEAYQPANQKALNRTSEVHASDISSGGGAFQLLLPRE